jgi:ammonium transporter, Amt family
MHTHLKPLLSWLLVGRNALLASMLCASLSMMNIALAQTAAQTLEAAAKAPTTTLLAPSVSSEQTSLTNPQDAANTAHATALATLNQQVKDNTLHLELLVLMLAGALVFMMQLGFAFLESGMSRSKNTVNVLMKNFCDCCVGGIVFWAVGYGLLYGANPSGWIGTSSFFPAYLSSKEAGILFFQMMFAAAAATIVSGAIAERTRFYAYIFGSIVICGLIYPIVGSWIWGGNHGGQGWLKAMGFIDFAGSTVVHSVGGWCALAALIVVKPRLGRYAADGTPRLIQGHSLSNTLLGGFVLWFGWFGFNAGSVVVLDGSNLKDIGKIALNTHLAGCGGALGAMLTLKLMKQRTMLAVTMNGAIAGLVAVTAASNAVAPQWAIVIGLIAGMLASAVQPLMDKRGLDDVVGAVSVHLVGGIWGTLAAGLFASQHFLSLKQLLIQFIGVAAVGIFTFSAAYILYRTIHGLIGMRVSPLEEQRGLDISEHAEVGYPEFQRVILHTGAAAAQSTPIVR